MSGAARNHGIVGLLRSLLFDFSGETDRRLAELDARIEAAEKRDRAAMEEARKARTDWRPRHHGVEVSGSSTRLGGETPASLLAGGGFHGGAGAGASARDDVDRERSQEREQGEKRDGSWWWR